MVKPLVDLVGSISHWIPSHQARKRHGTTHLSTFPRLITSWIHGEARKYRSMPLKALHVQGMDKCCHPENMDLQCFILDIILMGIVGFARPWSAKSHIASSRPAEIVWARLVWSQPEGEKLFPGSWVQHRRAGLSDRPGPRHFDTEGLVHVHGSSDDDDS